MPLSHGFDSSSFAISVRRRPCSIQWFLSRGTSFQSGYPTLYWIDQRGSMVQWACTLSEKFASTADDQIDCSKKLFQGRVVPTVLDQAR
jgi:hypothetical protein